MKNPAAVVDALPVAAAMILLGSTTNLIDDDPVRWCEEVLGIQLTSYQAEIMRLVRDNPRVAVRSCNAIGKDFDAAALGLWWVHQGDDSGAIYTAPTWHQVEDIQWHREIHRLHLHAKRRLPGKMRSTEYRIDPEHAMIGVSTNNKEAMQGFHPKRGLIVVTEASAQEFDKELWEGIDTLMASGDFHLLMLSNPTRQSGQFYEAFHSQAHRWVTLHIGADDTPNVAACNALGKHEVPEACAPAVVRGLVTHEWTEDMRSKYGAENDFIRVHVDGDFPEQGADNVIPLTWIELALERVVPEQADPIGLGVDVARMGGDMSCLATQTGRKLAGLDQWGKTRLTATAGRVLRAFQHHQGARIAVDDTGVGGGVTDNLIEAGVDVIAVNFGSNADEAAGFPNKVSELWWRGRQALDPDNEQAVAFPREHPLMNELAAQLAGATYRVDGKGRIVVDKMGGGTQSPDLADAWLLALEAQTRGGRRWVLA